MKKIFTLLLLVASLPMLAQQYNNEWIRYNQTYYKFKVGKDGVYRISKSTLEQAGLGSVPVESLELWRNGELVPVYPSVNSGVLPEDGFIEFYGKRNDGKPDRDLYRDPQNQHSDRISLMTDTAMYFLSVNNNSSGRFFQNTANDIAANTLGAEPYFMHKLDVAYRNIINPGYAVVIGEYIYSSSFDKGEFWSSTEIRPATNFNSNNSNLQVFAGGPESRLSVGAFGNALNTRSFAVRLNNTVVLDTSMDYFNEVHTSVAIPTGLLSANTANLNVKNQSPVSTDRMVISYFSLEYPRRFNFNNQTSFAFDLPAKPEGYYLEISGFNTGGVAPVLYDLSTNLRITGNIATAGLVKFAIPGSSVARSFVLVSHAAANLNTITSLTAKQFRQFNLTANQGNYLIISHPYLYNGTNGRNPVADYKSYRESAIGGGYTVQLVEIEELVDQFAFGIKGHPLSVKNFLRYARANFAAPMKNVFLIGKGATYNEYRLNESKPQADLSNLIPTFGNPASDNMLSSSSVTSAVAETPIGRLSVVSGAEIEDYLEKVIQYEAAQRNSAQTIADRAWMKNVVHVTGSSEVYLGTILCNYMGVYRSIIQDTTFGAHVHTFCKTTTNPVEQLNNEKIRELFKEGISVLTYFGHSSATTLEFNLDDPQNYDNDGKYPVFFVNGCSAGNFYTYNLQRFESTETLSEKFTLAKRRGGGAFVASSHYGIVNYLNLYVNNLYRTISESRSDYTLGEIQQYTLRDVINVFGANDFYSRMHAEQITLHGDPALKLNSQPKPDYVLEEPQIQVNPSFISIAESSFEVKIKAINLGIAIRDSVTLHVKRQFPDGSVSTEFVKKIAGIKYADSIQIDIPVVATRDKGLNKLIITIDSENDVDEISESNNTVTRDVFIYEDEARPVYPYNFSIIKKNNQKLYASTANPFSLSRQYVMEMDTTEKFNSAAKISKTVTASGGVMEFDPGINYKENIVYYWRVAGVPLDNSTEYRWNLNSFMYVNGDNEGFSQSHFYQHAKSGTERLYYDSVSKEWNYGVLKSEVFAMNGIYPTAAVNTSDFAVSVNSKSDIASACVGNSIIFHVFDSKNMQPWKNVDAAGKNLFKSGSLSANCHVTRNYNFEFSYMTAASRKNMMNFIDSIPDGYYVFVRSSDSHLNNSMSATWRKDTSLFGSNNSLYHRLLAAGMMNIDSLNSRRAWMFMFKKNDASFEPKYVHSQGIYDRIYLNAEPLSPDSLGYLTSPRFGPSKQWKEVIWNGYSKEPASTDNPTIDVIGINHLNMETVLYTIDKDQRHFDISEVDAESYPYMKLRMRNVDSVSLTPFQLSSWKIHYEPVPEGVLAPNIFFTTKDTVELGEPLKIAVAFKNISDQNFDSLRVKAHVLDQNNVPQTVNMVKYKPLITGDTVVVVAEIDTRNFPGKNTLFLEVNPDFDQPEQYNFNNFIFRDFYVRPDQQNPLLDVTFDGVHILNRDIVSSKPHIQIRLKDEAKHMLLNDTSLASVKIRYPDGRLQTYRFDNDTLRFIPATNGDNNTAMIDFFPQFIRQQSADGDDYELIVQGRDRSGNRSGQVEYRVGFKVISKPMISNLLNYPNPFTTSTAFVFTLTGSEVPQNMKIQILTVTGKIVREITKEELGPIRIGRNITEFKWDGTDQFGQRLANGVYLYRFVTTLNGNKLEKYKSAQDDTDKYFNNGYGKMYLMR